MFPAGLFFLLILGVGCSPSTDWDDPRVFRYNESTGLLSLDPAQARSMEPMWVVDQIFDGLTQLDANLEVQPCIATHWVVDSTGTVYTFALRDDVHFAPVSEIPGLADGRKVVAQDVEFSLNRLLDADIASAGGWILEPLEKGRADGGIEVLDEQHIRFHLTTAFPAFPGLLSTVYASVIPREAVAHYGLDFRRNPVGTGPFKLAWWEEDVAMVLHRNKYFWEKDADGVSLPYLEAVHIDFVRDAGAEAAGLKTGKYDFVSGLHAAYMEDLLTASGSLNPSYHDAFRMLTTPYLKTDYIGLNVDASLPANSNSPFLDVRVRKALSLALDRQAMATHLKRGTVVPTDRFTPPALVGRSEPLPVAESLQMAKALLAQAGYPDGLGWPEGLKLLTTTEHADLCAALQHSWLQLGVNIGIEVVPPGVHRESVSAGEAPMFRKTWLGDYADAENFLALFVSTNAAPSGPNYSRFQDSLYDHSYGTAVAEVDANVRQQLYAELDASIHDQMPVIPLFHDQVIHFVRHNIENWSMNGVNRLDLRRVRKSRPHVVR